MAEFQDPQTLKQRDARAVSTVTAPAGLFQCLVVSVARQRRQWLATAAVDGGWETVKFADPCQAAMFLQRRKVRLAIFDLEGTDGRKLPELRELVAEMTTDKETLSIVCGHQGQTEEEIWARQLGVWLYLPGVTEQSDVGFLCGEAKDLTTRMTDFGRVMGVRRDESHGSE